MLLILSILLSGVRNIFSKGVSRLPFGTKEFFAAQSVIFISGSVILLFVTDNDFRNVAPVTIFYGGIYGLLLLSAQYCYTAALNKGNMGICSTIYSLGFIFPTLSGSFFWNEKLTVCNFLGILLVIPAIVISGMAKGKETKKQREKEYIFPLVVAMVSSGGLGIMQKVQQNSMYPGQKSIFIILAFAMAGIISFVLSLCAKKTICNCSVKKVFCAGGVGVAFAFSNFINTILAGRLSSAVFFPVQNIGTILFSVISGIIFYREKISFKDCLVLFLGITSILLITVI